MSKDYTIFVTDIACFAKYKKNIKFILHSKDYINRVTALGTMIDEGGLIIYFMQGQYFG